MVLIKATESHVIKLMEWFNTEDDLAIWSGPDFRFPFNIDSFIVDCKLKELNSYVLVDASGDVLAFGQYYSRLNKCHLGRLVVAPKSRGNNIGRSLINGLLELAYTALRTEQASLFVLADNSSAIKLYQSCGFQMAQYPEKLPLEGCLYMVKT